MHAIIDIGCSFKICVIVYQKRDIFTIMSSILRSSIQDTDRVCH
jgi:hypothetical protein